MKATAKNIRAVPSDIASRIEAIDWTQATADLDAQGCAVLKGLLSPDECRSLAALYPDDARFRSKIVMGRHGFGRGEYKYFAYPLPELIAELRPALYARLAAKLHGGAAPKKLSYRGVQPLFEGSEFSVNANDNASGMELWTANSQGQPTMKGTAEW